MGERLEMVDWVDDHSLLLGNAGGEKGQGGWEGEGGEQLCLCLLLLKLLQQQDKLHSNTSKTATIGAVQPTVAGLLTIYNQLQMKSD